MEEAARSALDPHVVQIFLYVISGLSFLVTVLTAGIAYFVKRLISKVDFLQVSVFTLNNQVTNATSELKFVDREIKEIKTSLDKYESEVSALKKRIMKVEVHLGIDDE